MEINNNRLTRGEELLRVTTPSRNSSRRIKLNISQEWLAYYTLRFIIGVIKERKSGIFSIPNDDDDTVVKDKEQVMEFVSKICTLLTTDNGKFGFMLLGNVGVGKTTIMKGIQLLLNNLKYNNKIGCSLRMHTAKEIIGYARNNYNNSFPVLENEPLLAIDDLGEESLEQMDYGTVTTPVIDLIEYRYDRRLFTCFSTNLTLKEIQAKYGDRVYDRLNEMCEFIGFAGESYR